MGKFDGKHITGLVGNLVFRKGEKGGIVQGAPRQVRQTEATKQESSLFGKGSILASSLRTDMNRIFNSNNDGQMVNRFNTPIKAILRQCYDRETQKFHFEGDSFSRLAGFEFNIRSLLINSLWVSPEMSLSGNTLTISLPEIKIPAQLKFPQGANVCELSVILTFTILDQALRKNAVLKMAEINKDQVTVAPQEFTFEVPDGCLCIAGLGLQYFSLRNNIKTPLNSKTFHPAGIVDAIITPGIFVLPPPVRTPTKTQGSEWQNIFNLTL